MYDYKKQYEWDLISGDSQSPIAIKSEDLNYKNKHTPIEFISNYRLIEEINDQTTIRLIGSGQLKKDEQIYDFQQVHFHYPAEHLINNKRYDLEFHLVHQSKKGDNLVIALMFEIGEHNNIFQEILDHFSKIKNIKVHILIDDLIPKNKESVHYEGSLTTPPLTEGIDWYLFTKQIYSISPKQFNEYQSLFKPNSRDLQLINSRKIEKFD